MQSWTTTSSGDIKEHVDGDDDDHDGAGGAAAAGKLVENEGKQIGSQKKSSENQHPFIFQQRNLHHWSVRDTLHTMNGLLLLLYFLWVPDVDSIAQVEVISSWCGGVG